VAGDKPFKITRVDSQPPRGNQPALAPSPPVTARRVAPAAATPSAPPPPRPPAPLDENVTAPAPVTTPKKKRKKTVAADRVGGQFRTPAALLAFAGALTPEQFSVSYNLRRGDGWWAEFPLAPEATANLILAAGGTPFGWADPVWIPLGPSGAPSSVSARNPLDVSAWKTVTLIETLVSAGLRSVSYAPAMNLVVIIPGGLAAFVLRRTMAAGVSVTITPAKCRSLGGGKSSGAKIWSVLLLRLHSERPIPASLVYALSGQPYTLVGVQHGQETTRLLVDVRLRPPVPSHLLLPLIPQDETWVLGTPDVGHWVLETSGAEIDGATLLVCEQNFVTPDLPATAPVLPKPIAVQLIRSPGTVRLDAVLLDDSELNWLRGFLMTCPLGEVGFLLPGPGAHLLMAPGGLAMTLPFGIPLTCIGPGGLYIETGTTFYPPLPAGARRERFGLDAATVVAVTGQHAFRFRMDSLVPVWSLWVGEAPAVSDVMPAPSARYIEALASRMKTPAKPLKAEEKPAREGVPGGSIDRPALLVEAARLELAGNLRRAAELLEQANEPGRAGRLYERAATGD